MSLILVVDDDPAMRELMAKRVEAGGHCAVLAEGGYQGLEVFVRFGPDLVVTDMSMPAGEGDELIAAIRLRAPEAKILAISGGLMAIGEQSGPEFVPAAVDAVLSKPFRIREFCAAVDRLLP